MNANLSWGADVLAWYGHTVTHAGVVTIAKGYISVTMDGKRVFSCTVTVPLVVYLYVTVSTDRSYEETVIRQQRRTR